MFYGNIQLIKPSGINLTSPLAAKLSRNNKEMKVNFFIYRLSTCELSGSEGQVNQKVHDSFR
jgi:hypothetical protein